MHRAVVYQCLLALDDEQERPWNRGCYKKGGEAQPHLQKGVVYGIVIAYQSNEIALRKL